MAAAAPQRAHPSANRQGIAALYPSLCMKGRFAMNDHPAPTTPLPITQPPHHAVFDSSSPPLSARKPASPSPPSADKAHHGYPAQTASASLEDASLGELIQRFTEAVADLSRPPLSAPQGLGIKEDVPPPRAQTASAEQGSTPTLARSLAAWNTPETPEAAQSATEPQPANAARASALLRSGQKPSPTALEEPPASPEPPCPPARKTGAVSFSLSVSDWALPPEALTTAAASLPTAPAPEPGAQSRFPGGDGPDSCRPGLDARGAMAGMPMAPLPNFRRVPPRP